MHGRDGNGRGNQHFHIRDFTGLLEKRLGFEVPELKEMEGEHGSACLEGSPEAFVAGLRTVVHSAGTGGSPNSWKEPNKRTLNNKDGVATAVLDTAKVIATAYADGDDTGEELLGVATAYSLFYLAVALKQGTGERMDSFVLYRFTSLAVRLTTASYKASTDEEFGAVLKRALELEEESHAAYEMRQLPRPGLWKWFPANRRQARLNRADGDGDLTKELRDRVMPRILAMNRDDGKFIREDGVVDRIIEEERSKLAKRDAFCETLRRNLEAAFREHGLPADVPVTLEVQGDGDGDLSKATLCAMKVNIGSSGFTVKVITDKPSNPLGELLAQLTGGRVGIETIEIG